MDLFLALSAPGGDSAGSTIVGITFNQNSVSAKDVTQYLILRLLGPNADLKTGDGAEPEIVTGVSSTIEAWGPLAVPDYYVTVVEGTIPEGAAARLEGPFDVSIEGSAETFLTLTENPFTTQPYPPEGPGPEAKFYKFVKVTPDDATKAGFAKTNGFDSYEEYVQFANPTGSASFA